MKKTIILFMVTAFSVISIFSACKQEDKTAPVVPPESAFVMDMSDFDDSPDGKATYQNYAYSVLSVAGWHTLLTLRMAVPVAAYVEALNNHEPVYQSDRTWLWSYEFPVGETTFSAGLYGTIEGDSADWKMYISREGVYKDFLWYKGKSALDRSGGYWILYESPTLDNELLHILWSRESDGVGNIKYTNIKQGGENNGAYIFYGNDNSANDFPHFYDIYNKGKAQLTEIEWRPDNMSGRVKDTVHFGDENWHCWDETLSDTECEPE